MTTMLTVEERRQWEKELVRYYLEELRRQGGPSISEEDAWKDIRIQSMTALAFWTLTVSPGEDVSSRFRVYERTERFQDARLSAATYRKRICQEAVACCR